MDDAIDERRRRSAKSIADTDRAALVVVHRACDVVDEVSAEMKSDRCAGRGRVRPLKIEFSFPFRAVDTGVVAMQDPRVTDWRKTELIGKRGHRGVEKVRGADDRDAVSVP